MNPEEKPHHWVPDTILLLGTDASGKNHVARLWASKLKELGLEAELREGGLCGKAAQDRGHDEKGWFSLLAERSFLVLFPLFKWMVPVGMGLLLHWDARRFRTSGSRPSGDKVLVVSHSALRILAFYLGQNDRFEQTKTLPNWLAQAIGRVKRVSGALVIVLDVDDATRQQRIQKRLLEGSIDPFDRFMAEDSERSERIEACLVSLAREYYGAHMIENNDLTDEVLWNEFQMACANHPREP